MVPYAELRARHTRNLVAAIPGFVERIGCPAPVGARMFVYDRDALARRYGKHLTRGFH